MQNDTIFTANKLNLGRLVIIVAIIFLLVLGVVSMLFINHISTSTIDLLFTPSSAIATIDGREYNSGKITVSTGVHEISIKKFGFETQTRNIETHGGETVSAYFILSSNEDYSSEWYHYHDDDAKLSEGITSLIAKEDNDAKFAKYAILEKLPVETHDYAIYRHDFCDAENLCIFISANPEKRDAAVRYFREHLDADIGKYKIIFNDYHNPFLGEG